MPADILDRTYAKVFWRLMPFLILCYVVAYLDRVNVGFAKLQMASQLGLSDTAYGLGAGIFFIGYFLFEVPSNLILHRVGARRWIARIMVSWGAVSAAGVFTSSETVFYVLRFLLGIAEAGFFPGIILYLTQWYPSERRTRVIGVFMAAVPLASIFGAPLSGWIMDACHSQSGWAGWQWMYLIEALPAMLLGVIAFFFLDDSIAAAKWLSAAEKAALQARLDAEHQCKEGSPLALRQVLSNGQVWLMAGIYFAWVAGLYGLGFWLPTLVQASGVQGNFAIGVLSAIPSLVAFAAMIVASRSSDHFRERRWHIVVPALLGAAGFALSTRVDGVALAITGLSLAAAGIMACLPLTWALPTAVLKDEGAAAGLAWVNSIGNLAGYLAPFLVGRIRDATGSSMAAMDMLAVVLLLGAAAVLRVPARAVNR